MRGGAGRGGAGCGALQLVFSCRAYVLLGNVPPSAVLLVFAEAGRGPPEGDLRKASHHPGVCTLALGQPGGTLKRQGLAQVGRLRALGASRRTLLSLAPLLQKGASLKGGVWCGVFRFCCAPLCLGC